MSWEWSVADRDSGRTSLVRPPASGYCTLTISVCRSLCDCIPATLPLLQRARNPARTLRSSSFRRTCQFRPEPCLFSGAIGAAVKLKPERVVILVGRFTNPVRDLMPIYVRIRAKADSARAIKWATRRVRMQVRHVFEVAHKKLVASRERLRFSDVTEVKCERALLVVVFIASPLVTVTAICRLDIMDVASAPRNTQILASLGAEPGRMLCDPAGST